MLVLSKLNKKLDLFKRGLLGRDYLVMFIEKNFF